MHEFPFTKREWRTVREAAREVAEAAEGALPSRRAARWADLREVLTGLRARHGEHPALLETEADFASDPPAAVALYRRAEELAATHGLPTLSIRLSLAGLLVKELGQPASARQALLACRDELPAAGEVLAAAWQELLAECDRQAPAVADTPAPGGMPTPVPGPTVSAAGCRLRTPGQAHGSARLVTR
jgi:hypothetical protein